jgi:acetyl esterase/lipase
MRRVVTIVFAALALVGAKCGPPRPPLDCTATGNTAHKDVRYASSPGTAARLQSLDLYVPNRPQGCGPVPLVAYVHGGAFVTGDKANKITDKVDLFTREGWAFASLNYRLVGAPGAGPTNGVYPAAEQDVADALGYLVEHADAHRIDPRNVMLLGHSAGAFLIALTSTDGTFLQHAGLALHDIRCTVPLDTTYDIARQIANGGTEATMFLNAFGTDPAVWAQASPPNNVAAGKGIPSFHIVTRGGPERVGQSQAFGTTLQQAGVTADVQVVRGLTHEEVNEAVGKPGDTVVTPPLMTFFRTCVSGGTAG